MSITYQYAQSDDGFVKHIREVSVEYRKDHQFACLGCGSKLEAVVNVTKRLPHFRHSESKCSLETYLHQLGKRLFKELFEKNKMMGVPLTIDYEVEHQCGTDKCKYCKSEKCYGRFENRKLDLIEKFTSIEVEKYDTATGLTPDILLSNANGDKLYVEIAVTHISTEDKIASGVPIVEIYLETEEDLNGFRTENGLTVTDLNRLNVVCFNMVNSVVNDEPYCTLEMLKARNSFKDYYAKTLRNNEGFVINFPSGRHCEKNCPYFKTVRCLNAMTCSSFDLTSKFKCIEDKECTDDSLVYADEKGNRIRFAFSVGLSSGYVFDDGMRTIQFGLKLNNGIFPWEEPYMIIRESDDIKFHNFKLKNFLSCGDYQFKGFMLTKDGRCTPVRYEEIPSIYEKLKAMEKTLCDYVVMGNSLQESYQFFPGDDVFKAVLCLFLKNKRNVRNCFLCQHCRKNWKKGVVDDNPVYCKKHYKTCRSGNAVDCGYYEINERSIDYYQRNWDLVELLDECYRDNRLKL